VYAHIEIYLLQGVDMKVLLVEDSPSDRELLRRILEAQLQTSEFHEASTLAEATDILERCHIDCTILDLQLPDSVGKETFEKLNARFPDVPMIVMTHSKDRELAISMIQQVAADFLIKSYTGLDEEDLYRRITFAVEKHNRSVRVPPESARYYNRLERAKVHLQDAHDQEASPSTIRNMTVEVTTAVADLSKKMFTELQQINMNLSRQGMQQETLVQTVATLDKELLKGHSNRPSMRSQVDVLDHRVVALEGKVKRFGDGYLEVAQAKMSNRTKILIAILTLLGVLGTATATYYTAIHKSTPGSKP
jgi:DNA-binding NarL/FixJ family response regulator